MNSRAPRVARLLLCLIILAGTGVSAHQGPPKPDAAPAAPSSPAASRSMVFERQYMRLRFEADGRSRRELTMHVRVYDDAAVRGAGQIPLVYAPSSDDLEITRLEVQKTDGRTITVGSDAIQDHAIQPGASTPAFIDLRQKTVTVPALQPGDLIVITAVWTVARPLAGKHSWFEHSFVKHAVVLDERLELDVPAGLQPVIRTAPGAPAEQNGGGGQLAGNRRVFTWRTSNGAVQVEDTGPPDEAPAADVRITTFPDWESFTRWLGPLLRPAPDDDVRAKAAELTRGMTDPADKLKALYSYVSTQIRYVSLSFGLGRYAPHAPGEVLKNQYGDCKDKHALLAAMLETVGITAVAVLVNTSRSIADDLPAPTEFDHVVTAVPTGDDPSRWTWMDTTAEIAPLGMLTAPTRGRRSLSLGTTRLPGRVLTTPVDGPFAFSDSLEIDGVISPLGVLTAKVRMVSRGDAEIIIRSTIRALPRESLDAFAKSLAKSIGLDGEVSNFSTSDPLETGAPIEMSFTLRMGAMLDWAAATSRLKSLTGLLDVQALDAERHPLKMDRKLGTPTDIHHRLVLRLPQGYTATAPLGVAATHLALRYSSAYTVDGATVTVDRRLSGQPRALLAAHAADYTRIAKAAASDAEQTFAVRRDTRTVPPVPTDMNARELYSAGYSAFEAQDYETAIVIFKASVDKDPKYFLALSGLGFAYQRLKRYDEAIKVLERQRSLDVTNKRINADLGFVYQEAERLEEAATAYARHLTIDPLDGPKHQILGEIYGDLERHTEAIASLEKASLLVNPADPWTHKRLGDSHLALQKRSQALEAYDRALALSTSPEMLSSIAWTLADEGLEAERVVELSSRGIAGVAVAMARVSAAEVKPQHFGLMENLAWAWDARGLVALGKGDTATALKHFTAAWQLAGHSVVSFHLGQGYEKQDRMADAASAYLTSRALDSAPDAALQAKMKKFYPTGDMELMLRSALRVSAQERAVAIHGTSAQLVTADFNAILNGSGRIVDMAFVSGAQELESKVAELRKLQFPLESPSLEDVRMAVRLTIGCEPRACHAFMQLPRNYER
ncbi:MAG: DUF3857 domain-containing protein [Acidobacteriota bacterium]|nr:DUF3857 domain-containing protein [Acidobacteriota bacterium]